MPRNEIAAIIGVLLAVVTFLGSRRGGVPGGRFHAPVAVAFLVGFAATWIVLFLAGY